MVKQAAGGRIRRAAGSVVLTRRGIWFLVGSAVSLILAPILSVPALLYVTGLLLGLVVVSSTYVFVGHSRVRIDRSFAPQVVNPGEHTHVSLRVTNLSVLPCLEARWEDSLPTSISGESSGTLPGLGGSHGTAARVEFGYVAQGLRRGLHPIGPLRLFVLDPFGLVHRRHAFGAAEPLTILPRRVSLPVIAPRGSDAEGATRPVPQHVGIGDDDVIARNYLPGDAMKRMHWKATAHRGELMVRQEEQQVNPRAALLLDTDSLSHGTALDHHGEWEYSPTLEWAISAAASIATHLVSNGFVVAMQSAHAEIDRVISEGYDTLEDTLVDLAVVSPTDVEVSFDYGSERTAFVVLGRPHAGRAREWTAALRTPSTILAFVASTISDEARGVLEAARWRVVTYRPQDDMVDVWTSLDEVNAHAQG